MSTAITSLNLADVKLVKNHMHISIQSGFLLERNLFFVLAFALFLPVFYAIVLSFNSFCLGMTEMQVSHTCIQSWKQH